jgi:hypothetical protein
MKSAYCQFTPGEEGSQGIYDFGFMIYEVRSMNDGVCGDSWKMKSENEQCTG